MKKLLLASLFGFVSIAGPALAADMPAYKAPAPAPYYNWSGYYIGFNIGGQWSEVERTFPNPFSGGFIPGSTFSTDSNDGIFGMHLGLQYQFGYWVLGIEAVINGGFHEMRSVSGVLPTPVGAGPGFTALT